MYLKYEMNEMGKNTRNINIKLGENSVKRAVNVFKLRELEISDILSSE